MVLRVKLKPKKSFMKKYSIISLLLVISFSCSQEKISNKYAETITSKDLQSLLVTYSSDKFEGRQTGEYGEMLAVNFLRDFYIENEIKPAKNTNNYFQNYQLNLPGQMIDISYSFPEKLRGYDRYARGENLVDTQNVASIIEGETCPNSYIIITGHLDHVGLDGDVVYNGADDNGSGTIGVLKIAEAFQNAVLLGFRPKRSIVFLHLTGEEKGLLGSKFYTDNPLYPLENTMVNLNIDMIGRIDPRHKNNIERYIYLIGTNLLSSELHEISESTNKNTTKLYLDYKYNDIDQLECIYYRSDHFHFVKNNIPAIFYFNGVHEDYHKPTDTAEKIEYGLLKDRIKLIFFTAWELANRNKSIEVDKNVDYSELVNCKRYIKLYNL